MLLFTRTVPRRENSTKVPRNGIAGFAARIKPALASRALPSRVLEETKTAEETKETRERKESNNRMTASFLMSATDTSPTPSPITRMGVERRRLTVVGSSHPRRNRSLNSNHQRDYRRPR